jgi:hypothetical protein
MRHLYLCFLFLMLLSSTYAQSRRFAIRAGATYGLMNFNKGVPAPVTESPNTWKTGYEVSLQMRVPLTDMLSFVPEYGYSRANGTDARIKTDYRFDYLNLPVLLHADLTPWLALNAGPKFDLLIHSTQKVNGLTTNITHDTEERNISGVIGAELRIADPLFIDLRYVHGYNHIGLGQRSSTTEFKWQTFSLAAKFAF